MNTCNNPNYDSRLGLLGAGNVYATPQAAVECKQSAPIPNTVGQIRALLCEIHNVLDDLTGALATVSVPQPCKEPDSKCAAPRPSGLLGELEEIRDGASSAVIRVKSLREGLLL